MYHENMKKLYQIYLPCAAIILLLSLTGCGKYGYKSEYTAEVDAQAPRKIAEMYYSTVGKAVDSSHDVAKDLAEACAKVGSQIGQPLAPAEAVHPRTKMAVTGSGKEFDIIEAVPPESLLPLAKERTEQVRAVSAAISRTADMARISVSAPAGYVQHEPKSWPIDQFWNPALDELPGGEGYSGVEVGVGVAAPTSTNDEVEAVKREYEEIRQSAINAVEKNESAGKN